MHGMMGQMMRGAKSEEDMDSMKDMMKQMMGRMSEMMNQCSSMMASMKPQAGKSEPGQHK